MTRHKRQARKARRSAWAVRQKRIETAMRESALVARADEINRWLWDGNAAKFDDAAVEELGGIYDRMSTIEHLALRRRVSRWSAETAVHG